MQRKGFFLVIEGTDGSGKESQFNLLKTRLQNEGYDVAAFDFPQHGQPSSFFIKEYVEGKFGTDQEVGPYTGSLFYALDHYQAATQIREALDQGKVVLANRFIGYNMALQGAQFATSEERKGYFIWADNLEFQMLRVPRPSASVVLRAPIKAGESTRQLEAYDDMCELFPRDFVRFDCVQNGQLQPTEVIAEQLWQSIQSLLPAKNGVPKAVHKYHIPKNFNATVTKEYKRVMDLILNHHAELVEKLEEYADHSSQVLEAARPVLPVATELSNLRPTANKAVQKLADAYLPPAYAAEGEDIRLASVWPRNEMSLLPAMLYEHSSLPLKKIEAETESWTYDRKVQVFEEFLTKPGRALENTHYSWDILCDYSIFQEWQQHHDINDLERQELTPRYGYEMPALVEEAGLSDLFEDCFDLSLQLNSYLQQAGHNHEAQYATLLGHKARWTVGYNAREAYDITSSQGSPGYRQLTRVMHEKLAEVHPLLAEALPL